MFSIKDYTPSVFCFEVYAAIGAADDGAAATISVCRGRFTFSSRFIRKGTGVVRGFQTGGAAFRRAGGTVFAEGIKLLLSRILQLHAAAYQNVGTGKAR